MMLHRGRAGFWLYDDYQLYDCFFEITLLF